MPVIPVALALPEREILSDMAGGPPRVRRILRTSGSACSDAAGHHSTGRIGLHQFGDRSHGRDDSRSARIQNLNPRPGMGSSWFNRSRG